LFSAQRTSVFASAENLRVQANSTTPPPAAPGGGRDAVHLDAYLRVNDDTGTREKARKYLDDIVLEANHILRRNRTGLILQFAKTKSQPKADLDGHADSNHCSGDANQVKDFLQNTLQVDVGQPSTLPVIVFQSIAGSDRAYACRDDDGKTAAIFLSMEDLSETTVLGHELGHVLGLSPPMNNAGHTTALPEFERSNLMWEVRSPPLLQRRGTLTIGQVLRMRFADRSWLPGGNPGNGAVRCPDTSGSADPLCPAPESDLPGRR
jgi:hypothetical protein